MKNPYRLLSIIIFVGILSSGLIWLLIYSLHFKPYIDFDGPAGLGLLGALILGDLTSSVLALVIFLKQNSKRFLRKALLTALVTSTISGLVISVSLLSYSSSHFRFKHGCDLNTHESGLDPLACTK